MRYPVPNGWRPTSDAILKGCLLSASFDVARHLGYHPFTQGTAGLEVLLLVFLFQLVLNRAVIYNMMPKLAGPLHTMTRSRSRPQNAKLPITAALRIFMRSGT
jgi:hypothetical protein